MSNPQEGFYKLPNGSNGWFSGGAEPPEGSAYLGRTPPAPTQAEQLAQWRSTATCESAKLKYVLADSYAILDDIEAVIAQQDGKVRSMWIFTNWSRNNQALIGMVTQMSQAIPDVKAVVDGAGGVDAFMDAWFKAGIDLIV